MSNTLTCRPGDYGRCSRASDIDDDIDELCKGLLGKRGSPEGKVSPRKLRRTEHLPVPSVMKTRMGQNAIVLPGQRVMRIMEVVIADPPRARLSENCIAYNTDTGRMDSLSGVHQSVTYITNKGVSDVRHKTDMARFMRSYGAPCGRDNPPEKSTTWDLAYYQPQFIYVGNMPSVKAANTARCPAHRCGKFCRHDFLLHIVGMSIDHLPTSQLLRGGRSRVYFEDKKDLTDARFLLDSDLAFPVCSNIHMEVSLDIAIYPAHPPLSQNCRVLLGCYISDYLYELAFVHSRTNRHCAESQYCTPATVFAAMLMWLKLVYDTSVSYTPVYLRTLLAACFQLANSSVSGARVNPHVVMGSGGAKSDHTLPTAASVIPITLGHGSPHGDHKLNTASGRQICYYILSRFQWAIVPLINPVDLLLLDKAEVALWVRWLLSARRFRHPGHLPKHFPNDGPGNSESALYVAYSIVKSVPVAFDLVVPKPSGFVDRTDTHYYMASYTVESFLMHALGWKFNAADPRGDYEMFYESCVEVTSGTPAEVCDKMRHRVRNYVQTMYRPTSST